MFLRAINASRVRGVRALGNQMRWLASTEYNPNKGMGFSFPAPRVLNEIADVEKLRTEDSDAIARIWREHHKTSDSALATVLKLADFERLMSRSKQRCAH